jgi:hypothetical protein
MAIAAVATTVIATNSNDKMSLIMQNVEALANAESELYENIAFIVSVSYIKEVRVDAYVCKVMVTEVVDCLEDGKLTCITGVGFTGTPHDCYLYREI